MQKCTKNHHTLLHRNADSLSQKPEEDDKEETRVVALSVSEQVLLHVMTCKVKVTIADGSSIIARARIDPGSSASFIHERLAQQNTTE